MKALAAATDFAHAVSSIRSKSGLAEALGEMCEQMGVRYFALSQHVDFAAAPYALRIHNYPDGWEDWYDAHRFGLSDPIHRASHQTAQGFFWRDVPRMIDMTKGDRHLLSLGKHIGLGEGVTVPAHVPGEAKGSCSFVAEQGVPLPEHVLPWAQLVGVFAFEGARRIARTRQGTKPRISERQRQCIALAGRGKSNKEIARRLGVGEQTVIEHMREARQRLGVTTRTQLVVRLLVEGALCFDDVTGSNR